MKSRITTSSAIALLGLSAAPAFAQSDWSGAYIGLYAGQVSDPEDGGDSILFDRNLDGEFGDTVLTSGNANAFSPGFCDGQAQGPTLFDIADALPSSAPEESEMKPEQGDLHGYARSVSDSRTRGRCLYIDARGDSAFGEAERGRLLCI